MKPDFSKFGLTVKSIMKDLEADKLRDRGQDLLRKIIQDTLLCRPTIFSGLYKLDEMSGSMAEKVLETLKENGQVREVRYSELTSDLQKSFTGYPFIKSIYELYTSRSGFGRDRRLFFPNHNDLLDLLFSHKNKVVKRLIDAQEEGEIGSAHLSKAMGITRITARDWLLKMERKGEITSRRTSLRGGPKRFRLSAEK